MRINVIVKENILSVFHDLSFPIVLSIILLLNLYIGIYERIFTEIPSPGIDFYWMFYFFDTFALILYSGYVGTKFFAREFDKKTITTLIVTPLGKKGVYFGKILAGLIIFGLLSAFLFLQLLIFFMVWGIPPLLFFYWYGIFTTVTFLSMLFTFFLTVTVGSLIKKTGVTLFMAGVYMILSFFIFVFVPMNDYIVDNRISSVMIFPNVGLWYMKISIGFYGILYLHSLMLASMGTLFMGLISYFIFQGVRI